MRSTFYATVGKRLFDIVAGGALFILLSPLMAVIAAAIKVDSAGPVLYRQERIGRNRRPFKLLKFRSMVVGAETKGAGVLVEQNDARITRVGRIIRRLSFDEFPQIFNVLAGHMSLVGPRPGLGYQVALYDEKQLRRLLVRPGVTGWAQVLGRNTIDWGRRIELDLEYIERMSLITDIIVLIRTVPAVLKGQDMIASADYWKEKARKLGAETDAEGDRATDQRSSGGPL